METMDPLSESHSDLTRLLEIIRLFRDNFTLEQQRSFFQQSDDYLKRRELFLVQQIMKSKLEQEKEMHAKIKKEQLLARKEKREAALRELGHLLLVILGSILKGLKIVFRKAEPKYKTGDLVVQRLGRKIMFCREDSDARYPARWIAYIYGEDVKKEHTGKSSSDESGYIYYTRAVGLGITPDNALHEFRSLNLDTHRTHPHSIEISAPYFET